MLLQFKAQLLQKYIEPKLKLLCDYNHIKLVTDNSIKSLVSIENKISKGKKIKDSLRYTIVCDLDNYTTVCDLLEHSYDCSSTNHWIQNKAYNGYHISVLDYCIPFEIQVHTKRSLYWRDTDVSRKVYRSKFRKYLQPMMYLLSILCQIEALYLYPRYVSNRQQLYKK